MKHKALLAFIAVAGAATYKLIPRDLRRALLSVVAEKAGDARDGAAHVVNKVKGKFNDFSAAFGDVLENNYSGISDKMREEMRAREHDCNDDMDDGSDISTEYPYVNREHIDPELEIYKSGIVKQR
ncbi:MAG: hypothetical protein LBB23_04930 [Rickettsiales bacterium]|jgi:hypothetical protein|nr:hypothetical protein [Rickettsiales bacterium]